MGTGRAMRAPTGGVMPAPAATHSSRSCSPACDAAAASFATVVRSSNGQSQQALGIAGFRSNARTGELERPAAVAHVDAVHHGHQLAAVWPASIEVQLALLDTGILQVKQHHPGLGVLEVWPVDRLQPGNCALREPSDVRDESVPQVR